MRCGKVHGPVVTCRTLRSNVVMVTGYCPHCHGPCVTTPPMTAHRLGVRGVLDKQRNLYHSQNWGVDCDDGRKFHVHNNQYFGVYNHYFGMGIQPTLICSLCLQRIPDTILIVLRAARKLWTRE